MLIYLASPYTDPDKRVRKKRAKEVTMLACRLMQAGHHIFSPIAHSHAIAECGDLPGTFEYWEYFDRRFLLACDALWIAALDGWKESQGIKAEINIMHSLGKPIRLVSPEFLIITELPDDLRP